MNSTRITLLVDSESARPDLETEHGLAFLIENKSHTLLFDSGASNATFRNIESLGLNIFKISQIIISHGHNDHTGGLAPFLKILKDIDIYLHPKSLGPKYSFHPGKPLHDLTMPSEVQELIQARIQRVHLATGPMRLSDGMGITGPIPRIQPVQRQSLYCDTKGREPDPLEDDMALWIRGSQGITVILGCAHAGVWNTLEHVRRTTGERRIHTVLGGMHLSRTPEAEVTLLIDQLRHMGVEQAIGIHCTGAPASRMIRESFKSPSFKAGDFIEI